MTFYPPDADRTRIQAKDDKRDKACLLESEHKERKSLMRLYIKSAWSLIFGSWAFEESLVSISIASEGWFSYQCSNYSHVHTPSFHAQALSLQRFSHPKLSDIHIPDYHAHTLVLTSPSSHAHAPCLHDFSHTRLSLPDS